MQDARDAQKISYASLCAQLLSIFWRSYSKFAANVQRTANALGVYRAHSQRVHCVHVKIGRIRAPLVVLGKFGKRISIGET